MIEHFLTPPIVGANWVKGYEMDEPLQMITQDCDRTRKLRQEEGNGRVCVFTSSPATLRDTKETGQFDINTVIDSVRNWVAGLLAALYLGVRDRLEPPPPLEGYGYDPAKAGILPMTLPAALDALTADADLTDLLGKGFVASYLQYKRDEVDRFARHVTDWEFREYAYHL